MEESGLWQEEFSIISFAWLPRVYVAPVIYSYFSSLKSSINSPSSASSSGEASEETFWLLDEVDGRIGNSNCLGLGSSFLVSSGISFWSLLDTLSLLIILARCRTSCLDLRAWGLSVRLWAASISYRLPASAKSGKYSLWSSPIVMGACFWTERRGKRVSTSIAFIWASIGSWKETVQFLKDNNLISYLGVLPVQASMDSAT